MYFTKLDLMRGYLQVKMAEESKEKTAFVCHRGLYQYCKMPFGLTNASATFQRLMDKLFTGWNFVFIYLDDILIASKSFSEHTYYSYYTSPSKIARSRTKNKAIKMYIW